MMNILNVCYVRNIIQVANKLILNNKYKQNTLVGADKDEFLARTWLTGDASTNTKIEQIGQLGKETACLELLTKMTDPSPSFIKIVNDMIFDIMGSDLSDWAKHNKIAHQQFFQKFLQIS